MRRFVLAALLVAATAAGVWAAPSRHAAHDPVAAAAKPVAVRTTLDPPGPIPGYLLIADRGNNRMLLVDSAKHILWRYPGGGRAGDAVPSSTTTRSSARGTTGSSPTRRTRTRSRSSRSRQARALALRPRRTSRAARPGYLNTPDDAYLLPNGLVSVADAYNCRVLFISPAHRIVRQYGTTGVCRHDPPRYLGAVNGATPLPDGGTLVSEINGSWIDDIGPNGTARWAVQAPVSYPSDPQLLAPDRILLADYSRPGARDHHDPHRQGALALRPVLGPGRARPSLARDALAPGLIAINDDYRDRVVIVSIRDAPDRLAVRPHRHAGHARRAT